MVPIYGSKKYLLKVFGGFFSKPCDVNTDRFSRDSTASLNPVVRGLILHSAHSITAVSTNSVYFLVSHSDLVC